MKYNIIFLYALLLSSFQSFSQDIYSGGDGSGNGTITYEVNNTVYLGSGNQENNGSFLYTINNQIYSGGYGHGAEVGIYSAEELTDLPITLASFEAEITEDNIVVLQWITASEINNDHFVIEKQKAGSKSWTEVGTVLGAGQSQHQINYTLRDTKPLSGKSYYRLRQVDFDGQSSTYGPLAIFNQEASSRVSIYPNPTQNVLTIEQEGIIAKQITFVDLSGKIVSNSIQVVQQNDFFVQLNIHNLHPGVYLIKIGKSNYRIIKQ
ncbi:T9SS type A sorting domain-containing protein [Flammeovirga sp. SubArs3]|uniref:T9SS type A sorting domain-containing protein n=1 Tax=Flammeovirga sp. SubArs3 TaxID=2995316 RepID=UPI00248A9731|nr:T9SS type A sorting domain-containing protein [Flammeovirga sp. SubArs3]